MTMQVITFSDEYKPSPNDVLCFMGGGMGNTDWHDIFLGTLKAQNFRHLVVINPYNPNITSAFAQIQWEFEMLNKYIDKAFIFSMYFDKYTDQPISMYELGRASVLSKPQYVTVGCESKETTVYTRYGFPCIVTVDPRAPKAEDIKIQCGLAKVDMISGDAKVHALRVASAYTDIRHQMGI